MSISTLSAQWFASPFADRFRDLAEELIVFLRRLGELLSAFAGADVTPLASHALEHDLWDLLRQAGRAILEWVFNHIESEAAPKHICHDHQYYRRRDLSPKRSLASLFGPIRLRRYRYEPQTPGEPALFPLEMRLGLEGSATAALAERAACWLADLPQDQVLAILRRDHGVHWAAQTLRGVTQRLSVGMAEHREVAQVAQLQQWLDQAEASAGPHRPVLSVGRDGVMVPLRGAGTGIGDYREAAAGTVSVLDRHGRRRGTVYLGRMPEEGQTTLSAQMTRLIVQTLTVFTGPLPRLQYVTDAGGTPKKYFREVLQKMTDPHCPGRRLQWQWVIDFYHCCTYVAKMAEALFKLPTAAWARKMCRWLRDKPNGVYRVLHSAVAHRKRRTLSCSEKKLFRTGYNYLKKHRQHMDYVRYRGRGLAIGSGVTEAACKTVFTQRLKQSGMRWEIAGGQIVVDLRTIKLSGIWRQVHLAYLASKSLLPTATQNGSARQIVKKAA
jgi:hypothetical protein